MPTTQRAPSTSSTGPPRASPLKQSLYLNSLVTDFSRELGDEAHTMQNISQALHLWAQSGGTDKEFGGLLYEAKSRVREYQGKQGLRGIENKMAYFFTVVRDLVKGKEQEQ
ncbi:MAG TPA: hypothetical protein VEY08_16150 [Chloroflexia bacterium]|nr:hypothetical protein [Chloroflexia bacterium]